MQTLEIGNSNNVSEYIFRAILGLSKQEMQDKNLFQSFINECLNQPDAVFLFRDFALELFQKYRTTLFKSSQDQTEGSTQDCYSKILKIIINMIDSQSSLFKWQSELLSHLPLDIFTVDFLLEKVKERLGDTRYHNFNTLILTKLIEIVQGMETVLDRRNSQYNLNNGAANMLDIFINSSEFLLVYITGVDKNYWRYEKVFYSVVGDVNMQTLKILDEIVDKADSQYRVVFNKIVTDLELLELLVKELKYEPSRPRVDMEYLAAVAFMIFNHPLVDKNDEIRKIVIKVLEYLFDNHEILRKPVFEFVGTEDFSIDINTIFRREVTRFLRPNERKLFFEDRDNIASD